MNSHSHNPNSNTQQLHKELKEEMKKQGIKTDTLDSAPLTAEDFTSRGTRRKTPEERAEINRQNSLKSTGPASQIGKARSSLNAIRFNNSTPVNFFQPDDLDAFDENLNQHVAMYRPVTLEEKFLVEKLARLEWKTKVLPICSVINELSGESRLALK